MPFVLPPPEPSTALRGGPTSESPTVQYASALFGIFALSPLSVPLNPLFCILKVGITAPPLPCSSTCTYLRFSLLSLPAPGAGGAGHLHPPAHWQHCPTACGSKSEHRTPPHAYPRVYEGSPSPCLREKAQVMHRNGCESAGTASRDSLCHEFITYHFRTQYRRREGVPH
jgi:hypothetical protein